MAEKTVYVQLLEEGSIAFRPTLADEIRDGVFRLHPTTEYDPDVEVWEFLPGSIVLCEKRRLHTDSGAIVSSLVAVAEVREERSPQ